MLYCIVKTFAIYDVNNELFTITDNQRVFKSDFFFLKGKRWSASVQILKKSLCVHETTQTGKHPHDCLIFKSITSQWHTRSFCSATERNRHRKIQVRCAAEQGQKRKTLLKQSRRGGRKGSHAFNSGDFLQNFVTMPQRIKRKIVIIEACILYSLLAFQKRC